MSMHLLSGRELSPESVEGWFQRLACARLKWHQRLPFLCAGSTAGCRCRVGAAGLAGSSRPLLLRPGGFQPLQDP